MEFYARVVGDNKQTLKEHIEGVLSNSQARGMKGLLATQELLARLHDLGKYSIDWQEYLMDSKDGRKDKVPHSPYGTHYISESFNTKKMSAAGIFAKDTLQYVVLAHHGLFDGMKISGRQSLDDSESRFAEKYINNYEEILNNYFREHNADHLKRIMESSYDEMQNIFNDILGLQENTYNFFLTQGILTRMLLSVLIDSDWSDAANFLSSDEEEWIDISTEFSWEKAEKTLSESINRFTIANKIDKLRNMISEECMKSHKINTGIYRLQVPTGGGKTLSVMRFALAHAKKHEKDRIIYTAPFKSIIDQTADVYRKYLISDDFKAIQDLIILEHHGDVVRERDDNHLWDYLTENWTSPIILTTLVQLLNTMFSSNKRSIRRCHSLYNSILIIDEFQAVPVKSKTLFNGWLNVLAKLFNTTIVLCTATQPPLEKLIYDEKTRYGVMPLDYGVPIDLVQDYYCEDAFQRTRVINEMKSEGFSLKDIEELIESRFEKVDTLLIILNTREAVRKLSKQLASSETRCRIYFLSNNMAPAHRKFKLNEIKEYLHGLKDRTKLVEEHEKILVVSTSLIEAGVDISFEEVIRSLTGLDSISQSAGRCNRNGEREIGIVRIINPMDEVENISKMEEVCIAQEVMIPILNHFNDTPEDYDNNILSHKAIDEYFRRFYQNIAKMTHYPINIDRIETSLYELLSSNTDSIDKYKHENKGKIPNRLLNQAFKTAGDIYEPIEDKSIRIITHWGRGEDIIMDLGRDLKFEEKAELIKESEQYSVAIYDYQFQKLKDDGAVYLNGDGEVWILHKKYYDDSIGLVMDPLELGLMDKTICF